MLAHTDGIHAMADTAGVSKVNRGHTMLKGIHFLLTYMCNLECDHCFLCCGPHSQGTFTLEQLRQVIDDAAKIKSLEWTYFEGGEPFLFFPLMNEGLRLAKNKGFKTGVVTNAYFATSVGDAELWFSPLCAFEISDLSISDDAFHSSDRQDSPAKRAIAAAKRLGMPVDSICIDDPAVAKEDELKGSKGEPVVGGRARFRGRAVEKLTKDLPTRPYREFDECPYEELRHPERVHLDSFGNVQVCQGLGIGNMWEMPLSRLVEEYDADSHPITGPLARGGPVMLARELGIPHEDEYVDACHFCYLLRKSVMDGFPQYLAPRQVYGLD
jgi:organic radical activating enzyme